MKRMFGLVEVVFNIIYMLTVLTLGIIMLSRANNLSRYMTSLMALILVFGDMFHLIPRLIVYFTNKDLERSLGRGKQITSITMTFFYLMLWYLGVILFEIKYVILLTIIVMIITIIRVVLCYMRQNNWTSKNQDVKWGIIRNIPFVILGGINIAVFYVNRNVVNGLNYVWLAILLSFIFYLPVVLWASVNPKIGMLMLPKTICYVWLIIMFISI